MDLIKPYEEDSYDSGEYEDDSEDSMDREFMDRLI